MTLAGNETIATERLDLEPIERRHAALLHSVLDDARIYRYLPGGPPTSTAALADRYEQLESRLSPDGKERWLNWAMRRREDGVYLGTIQATIRADASGYLAYVLGTRHQRAGFATEACTATLTVLFLELCVPHVMAEVDTRNLASIGLLERLGFQRIGFQKDADFFDGHSSDEYVYDLAASSWRG